MHSRESGIGHPWYLGPRIIGRCSGIVQVDIHSPCQPTTHSRSRTKARQAGGELLKELNGRWQTGHDLCTISAYNSAFEDCREDDAYDLGKRQDFSIIQPI